MAGETKFKSKSAIKPLAVILVVIGVVLLAYGIIYLTVTTPHLPFFVPGKPTEKVIHLPHFRARHYTKRAIAAFILAGIAFIGAWYASGTRERIMRGR
jgi:hypothetical protein